MCKDYETVLMPIPEFILNDPECIFKADDLSSYDGGEKAINEKGEKCFVIDACIAPAIQILWAAGIRTTGSCCGHGSGSGVIGLATYWDRIPGKREYSPRHSVDERRAYADGYIAGRERIESS